MGREEIFEEINLIPEDKLPEVYAILHYFRLGLEASRSGKQSVMQYAGCWQDMPAEMYAQFTQEIASRRQDAFSRRRAGGTKFD
ncbi:MAG TPA: hypothetical protein VF177_13050 [Anaerolineae bacterium]